MLLCRSPKPTDLTQTSPEQRNKRKMFVPQQHGSSNGDVDVVNDDDRHSPAAADANKTTDAADREKELLKDQLKIMGEQLHKMQQRYAMIAVINFISSDVYICAIDLLASSLPSSLASDNLRFQKYW